ncbi:4-coumarate-CoA ligase [Niveomyces insectorum RCEF 264]|uniref:4-coumarate-CoA ligase n=1 Tax=Niveomyces insectorum RCEF 264 TaxID=1081102 RepID=A0A168AB50_9HYPO|nr:4-coumarate-CoA ligase [Niveomyces insectorum RCEF 264]
MTIRSRWSEPVPRCSLQQWIFGSSQATLPDKKTFIDPERPDTHFLTKADYRLLAKRVALGLLDAGLQPGDRVLLFSGNTLYFPAVFLGVLMAGGIFSGANPTFVARELAYQLRDSGARFMVAAAGSLSTALEAADAVGLPRNRLYLFDEHGDAPADVARTDFVAASPRPPNDVGSGLPHWLDLVAGNLQRALVWDWTEPADPETTTCCLNYSSGTTGLPKGVEISHYAYVANCCGVVAVGNTAPDAAAQRQRTVGLCLLPLYHAFGQTYFIAQFAQQDVPVYVMPRFDFEKMLQHIQRFRITNLTLVPPIAVALSKHPLVKKYDLGSVETVGCGAAPLAEESVSAMQGLWPAGNVRVHQGWGMTEVTCTCLTWGPFTEGTGLSVGELVPNCAARLVNVDHDDGDGPPAGSGSKPTFITEPNTPGELWVTGPTLMRGYWRNPQATAATIHVDAAGIRWLKTGDIAYVDRYATGGTFYIVERRKELIKVKGHQVAPAELEAVLIERADVADAAVIGVHRNGQEHPRAYIVRVPGTAASAEDIAAWTAARVTSYKRLTGGVVFVEAIPKTPLVTGWAQSLYYSVTIRAGDPRPQPGTPRFAEHRRRIHILVVALYLAYTIYEADYDLRRAGSFYQDLGIPLTASERDVKARFRRLAALHHPDKAGAGGSNTADAVNAYFVHLKTAADTLLDPARRFAYDRFGPASVAWATATGGPQGRPRCSTVYDFVALGVRVLVPYYTIAAAVLYVLGLLGYLTWGRFERWLVLASVLVFELHTVTRPAHPRLLTSLINPLLVRFAPLHAPYLPFQAVALARKLSITTYIGFSQIGPLLGADTRNGQIVTGVGGGSSSGAAQQQNNNDPALLAALERLEATSRSLDADATRLLEMEMAPFVGQEEVLSNVRGKVKEWLVQNTIRADPMVRDAIGRSLQRRRTDAPAGARGSR